MRYLKKASLLLSLLLLSGLTLTGCRDKEKEAITACISDEFQAFKSNDTAEIAEHFSNSALLSELGAESLPDEIAQVFPLFFQDLDVSVKEITYDNKKKTKATAIVDVQTIDAKALAKDFASLSIVQQLQNQASPSAVEYTLEDSYHSLAKLLKENQYPTVSNAYRIPLSKSQKTWQMHPDDSFSDVVVNHFMTYAADPDLLSPEEIIALHFDTIKSFDTEQMNQFLSLDELFSAEDEYKRNIAKALASQILQYLDYKITDSTNNGINASVTTEVTLCDWDSIIQNYTKGVEEYAASSAALEADMPARLTKANQILLDCINTNKESSTNSVTLNLVNDGTNWKLNMDDAFTAALLGNLKEAVDSVSAEQVGTSTDASESQAEA